MSEVTKADLWDLRDSVAQQMKDGFDGVHRRLDVLNGRVGKGEVASAQHGVRLTNVEREVFPSGRRKHNIGVEGRRLISERDVRVVLATLSIVGAVVLFVWKILPALAAVAKVAAP